MLLADVSGKGIAASLLEKRVNEEMNGKACMQVFPNSTLYDDKKVLEAMLNGDVQLAAPSLSKFENFTKVFRIFDLPFMFKNIEADWLDWDWDRSLDDGLSWQTVWAIHYERRR